MSKKPDLAALSKRKTAKERTKPKSAPKASKRQTTVRMGEKDDAEIVRLSRMLVDAGILPRLIEESKIIRLALRLALLKGAGPAKAAELYTVMIEEDKRRTRK